MRLFPEEEDVMLLACETNNDARRIIHRCINKMWWCMIMHRDGHPLVAIPAMLDVDSDIRERLAGIKFTIA